MELQIYVQRTPNPKSLKFILNTMVINEGKATFNSVEECNEIALAKDLLSLKGVSQIYFYENMITVTQETSEWDQLEDEIREVLKACMPSHDPAKVSQPIKQKERHELSPELQKIEEILDRTIRPGLQSDGGDLELVSYRDNELVIRYEGACGTCPSAMSGTLYAIEDILRQELNLNVFVSVENEFDLN